ncbi:hypothetical protein WAI453_008064 [Rhynchosporium graminicola]
MAAEQQRVGIGRTYLCGHVLQQDEVYGPYGDPIMNLPMVRKECASCQELTKAENIPKHKARVYAESLRDLANHRSRADGFRRDALGNDVSIQEAEIMKREANALELAWAEGVMNIEMVANRTLNDDEELSARRTVVMAEFHAAVSRLNLLHTAELNRLEQSRGPQPGYVGILTVKVLRARCKMWEFFILRITELATLVQSVQDRKSLKELLRLLEVEWESVVKHLNLG